MGWIDQGLHQHGIHYNCGPGTACAESPRTARRQMTRATLHDVPPDLDIEAGDVIEAELEEIMREGWHKFGEGPPRDTRNIVNTIRAREAAVTHPAPAVYCSECGLESHESYWVIWSETYCPECFNRLYPDQEED